MKGFNCTSTLLRYDCYMIHRPLFCALVEHFSFVFMLIFIEAVLLWFKIIRSKFNLATLSCGVVYIGSIS